MFELPLTSLVPSVIELISFGEKNWPHIWWFPHWYLGLPYRFLIGPIVPLLVVAMHSISPHISINHIYIGLVVVSHILSGLLIILFTRELGAGKRGSLFSGIFYLGLPFSLILFSIGNGLYQIATVMVIAGWWSWERYIKSEKLRWVYGAVTLGVVVLFINLSSFLSFSIGLMLLILLSDKNKWFDKFVVLSLTLATSVFLASSWYTPRFWLVLLSNPSFAGQPLIRITSWIIQIVLVLIPLVVGIWVVQKRYRLSSKLIRFTVIFLASFGFLTLIRFLSDIDFWIDWSGYGLELQIGLALLLPVLLSYLVKLRRWSFIVIGLSLTLCLVNIGLFWNLFSKNAAEIKTYKKEIQDLINIDDHWGNQRIFLSGSPVFWLGSRVPGLLQVRGNRDEAATHKTWAMGAYEIREGQDNDLLLAWMKILGVSRLLLHTSESRDFFHDFKNVDRFSQLDVLVENDGDRYLAYSSGFLARVADENILTLPGPKEGNDRVNIITYASQLKEAVEVHVSQADHMDINLANGLSDNQIISLAVAYDTGWQELHGASLSADSYGNTAILPKPGQTAFTLVYREPWFGRVVSVLVAGLTLLSVHKVGLITAFLKKRSPSISTLHIDEEDQY